MATNIALTNKIPPSQLKIYIIIFMLQFKKYLIFLKNNILISPLKNIFISVNFFFCC